MTILRILMGVCFSLALILVEFGVAEIALSRDDACREQASLSKLGIVPADYCMSDNGRTLMLVFSYGFYAPTYTARAKWMARLVTGIFYALFGGGLALLPPRRALAIFGGVHLALVMLLFFFTYISGFLVP